MMWSLNLADQHEGKFRRDQPQKISLGEGQRIVKPGSETAEVDFKSSSRTSVQSSSFSSTRRRSSRRMVAGSSKGSEGRACISVPGTTALAGSKTRVSEGKAS